MTNTNGSHTATVETLTAKVRVLMVGSRQVTLSVYKQLDFITPYDIEPFGRVHSGEMRGSGVYKSPLWLELVGRDPHGNLVKSCIADDHEADHPPIIYRADCYELHEHRLAQWPALRSQLLALPLIVLAGLR
jgi:hypothetical protein